MRDVPGGQEPFESKIIRKYQRRSDTIDETFMKPFIEGLATHDFEPALRLMLGENRSEREQATWKLIFVFRSSLLIGVSAWLQP